MAVVNGSRIRAARLKKGWTQAQLARATRTSERNIVRWEHDQNQPRISSVALIAEATGHDLEFFLAASDEADDEEAAGMDAPLVRDLVSAIRAVVREEVDRELAVKS